MEDHMQIVTISFVAPDGPNMLMHYKSLLENPKHLVAIHPRYDKLITTLRSAMATEMKLNKTKQSMMTYLMLQE